MTTYNLSNEEFKALRDWLYDCCNSDEDTEQTDQLSNDAVFEHVKRNYHGGVDQCLKDYL